MQLLGIGPLELLLIAVIAVIVLGPKGMVNGAREAGKAIRKIVRSPIWHDIVDTSREIREFPKKLAREAGSMHQADYVLIGSIEYYLAGHTTRNAVTVTARLLEVATGETIYFATGYGSGKPGKTFLLLDYKSAEHTPSATSVLSAVVENLIKDCFNKGFFGSLKTIIS